MDKAFKILSIDGGGIRGILPGMILAQIEKRTQKPICELFDFIAGTSTGAILALGLTKPGTDGKPIYTALDGINVYEKEGPKIFSRSLWREISTLDSLTEEKYPGGPMEEVLQQFLGDTLLSQALTPVFITSYDIEKRTPWFFRSENAIANNSFDFPMRLVARAATAAPTYFEPARIQAADGQSHTLVDGGVFANNPTMCAFVDVLKDQPDVDHFHVVSLGTGDNVRSIPYDEARNWGMIGWLRPGIDILLNGSSTIVDYQMRHVLAHTGSKQHLYYRFQAAQLGDVNEAFDDASPENIRALKQLGEKFVSESAAQLDQLCGQLLEN